MCTEVSLFTLSSTCGAWNPKFSPRRPGGQQPTHEARTDLIAVAECPRGDARKVEALSADESAEEGADRSAARHDRQKNAQKEK